MLDKTEEIIRMLASKDGFFCFIRKYEVFGEHPRVDCRRQDTGEERREALKIGASRFRCKQNVSENRVCVLMGR